MPRVSTSSDLVTLSRQLMRRSPLSILFRVESEAFTNAVFAQ